MKKFFNGEQMSAVMNDKKFFDTFGYLWDRWFDEKDYEDINDYKAPLVPILTRVLGEDVSDKMVMTKRPFGFVLKGIPYKTQSGVETIADVTFKISSKGELSWGATAAPTIKIQR